MSRSEPALQLASGSPRRAELLTQIGVSFSVISAPIDESRRRSEAVQDFVVRLAKQKAEAGFALSQSLPTLGADTVVVCKGEVFGKPENEAHFCDMMKALSGSEHQVLTAVAVGDGDRMVCELTRTKVQFRALCHADIRAYWRSGEPRDKAGGYAIQGGGAVFIETLQGTYSGVVGLPLFETAKILTQFDIPFCLTHAEYSR